MEAALLPDERTDLVSTNRLGHGWAYQKLANQEAMFRGGYKDGCDWLSALVLQPICRDQSGALNSMIKMLNAISVLSILLNITYLQLRCMEARYTWAYIYIKDFLNIHTNQK